MLATNSAGLDWRPIAGKLRVVRLTPLVGIAIPSLVLPAVSKSTRGVSFQPGKGGFVIGLVLVLATAVLSVLIWGLAGILVALLPIWLLGTTGVAMMASSLRPLAFVKPICVKCRLLPVIMEHEAIHLAGVVEENDVWESMKERYSVESLKLEGDPAICSFCPIPKRLSEH